MTTETTMTEGAARFVAEVCHWLRAVIDFDDEIVRCEAAETARVEAQGYRIVCQGEPTYRPNGEGVAYYHALDYRTGEVIGRDYVDGSGWEVDWWSVDAIRQTVYDDVVGRVGHPVVPERWARILDADVTAEGARAILAGLTAAGDGR